MLNCAAGLALSSLLTLFACFCSSSHAHDYSGLSNYDAAVSEFGENRLERAANVTEKVLFGTVTSPMDILPVDVMISHQLAQSGRPMSFDKRILFLSDEECPVSLRAEHQDRIDRFLLRPAAKSFSLLSDDAEQESASGLIDEVRRLAAPSMPTPNALLRRFLPAGGLSSVRSHPIEHSSLDGPTVMASDGQDESDRLHGSIADVSYEGRRAGEEQRCSAGKISFLLACLDEIDDKDVLFDYCAWVDPDVFVHGGRSGWVNDAIQVLRANPDQAVVSLLAAPHDLSNGLARLGRALGSPLGGAFVVSRHVLAQRFSSASSMREPPKTVSTTLWHSPTNQRHSSWAIKAPWRDSDLRQLLQGCSNGIKGDDRFSAGLAALVQATEKDHLALRAHALTTYTEVLDSMVIDPWLQALRANCRGAVRSSSGDKDDKNAQASDPQTKPSGDVLAKESNIVQPVLPDGVERQVGRSNRPTLTQLTPLSNSDHAQDNLASIHSKDQVIPVKHVPPVSAVVRNASDAPFLSATDAASPPDDSADDAEDGPADAVGSNGVGITGGGVLENDGPSQVDNDVGDSGPADAGDRETISTAESDKFHGPMSSEAITDAGPGGVAAVLKAHAGTYDTEGDGDMSNIMTNSSLEEGDNIPSDIGEAGSGAGADALSDIAPPALLEGAHQTLEAGSSLRDMSGTHVAPAVGGQKSVKAVEIGSSAKFQTLWPEGVHEFTDAKNAVMRREKRGHSESPSAMQLGHVSERGTAESAAISHGNATHDTGSREAGHNGRAHADPEGAVVVKPKGDDVTVEDLKKAIEAQGEEEGEGEGEGEGDAAYSEDGNETSSEDITAKATGMMGNPLYAFWAPAGAALLCAFIALICSCVAYSKANLADAMGRKLHDIYDDEEDIAEEDAIRREERKAMKEEAKKKKKRKSSKGDDDDW